MGKPKLGMVLAAFYLWIWASLGQTIDWIKKKLGK